MVSARSICFLDNGFVHFELRFLGKRSFQLCSYVLDEERHGKMLEYMNQWTEKAFVDTRVPRG